MFQLIFSNIVGIVLYLGVINLLAAAVTVYDKKQARAHGRRVPEKNLFTLAILGGVPAMLVTMHIIRHKTQHKRFMLGLPLLLLAQLIIVALLYRINH
ncbi:MAG: DUF1294 domain-containing protein [Clostridium sp.]|uniref:DUF1294 domain-containing protein n=1 Tax=Clostridium sp. TaxID=1506 RepID=UPI002907EBB1|nr:DUF1294 domain-containing protein [Clostridium sp.]MDU7337251.1 DUF1294 domain-containing protein [Clostridium sp.]